jgi:hypothetical protein
LFSLEVLNTPSPLRWMLNFQFVVNEFFLQLFVNIHCPLVFLR